MKSHLIVVEGARGIEARIVSGGRASRVGGGFGEAWFLLKHSATGTSEVAECKGILTKQAGGLDRS